LGYEKFLPLIFSIFLFLPIQAEAALMDIAVTQDTNLLELIPNANTGTSILIPVHESTFSAHREAILGIDMTPLTSLVMPGDTLVINSMTLNVFVDTVGTGGDVDVALANSDLTNELTATWANSNGQHGATLDTLSITPADASSFAQFDVSSVALSEFTSDDFLTFFLFSPIGTQSNYAVGFVSSEIQLTNQRPSLLVDFDIISAPSQPVGGEMIPLDSTMILVAGTHSVAAWMIPVIISAIGFAIVIARKF